MKKRTFALILALILSLSAFAAVPVAAEDEAETLTSGDWEYVLSDDGSRAAITRYFGADTDVTVPAEIDGFPVYGIAALFDEELDAYIGVFKDAGVKSVTLSAGMSAIGKYAFSGADDLESVVMNDGLIRIGDYAFYCCEKLQSVTLPSSLRLIGEYAFSVCTALPGIDIPYGVEDVGYGALSYCYALKTLTVPGSVKSFGGAFYCSELETVVIEDGVRWLREYSFYGCAKLANVTIPESVSWIGAEPFKDTPYEADPANWDGEVFYAAPHYLHEAPDTLTGNYTVRAGTKVIGEYAFSGCTELTGVTFTPELEVINYYAFYQCPALEDVTFPEGLEYIGDYAFSECDSLKQIEIPGSVKEISECAFYKCAALENVVIRENVGYIGPYAFSECDSLKRIEIHAGVDQIDGAAFALCAELESVTFLEGAETMVENYVFYGCVKLAQITLPDTVKYVGYQAFYNTAYLNDPANYSADGAIFVGNHLIQVPDDFEGVYKIAPGTKCVAAGAFYECSKLTGVTVPDSVVSIGRAAFYNCESLTAFVYPEDVIWIEPYTFSGCTALSEVFFTKNVEWIGEFAFEGCEALGTVKYGGNEEDLDAIKINEGNDPLFAADFIFNAGFSGDVCGDGTLNAKDVISLLRLIAGWTDDGAIAGAADFNGDGRVNARDAFELMKAIVDAC